ncbi:hypothetical protein OIN60_17020 [Paenibacillus sp. P96]|uniref:Uncharacterized protein n=1 Tax=Paenibacillus zeirhizosphaerae TaxID=2987519 RepID=A0ABT9FUL7_9BACL|nr:hypothetical protein [Paenibacillus sp. P96]MDP4098437.1 hypothetical protein [Paenibacillus sp. P96]
MRVKLNFTNKGKNAIEKFDNDELIEIFSRYSNTLTKKYDLTVAVPDEANPSIINDGFIELQLEQVNCDVNSFLKELGRDIKVPLVKRLGTKLDNVFKTEVIETEA